MIESFGKERPTPAGGRSITHRPPPSFSAPRGLLYWSRHNDPRFTMRSAIRQGMEVAEELVAEELPEPDPNTRGI